MDLCTVRTAKTPYYIENISANIYSIEELCFYLYENVYLIDGTIVNEKLCDWIRDELGLTRLGRQMMEHLQKEDGIAYFILPIFREAGYLEPKELRAYQDALAGIEVQQVEMRRKLKADYLVRCGMFSSAVTEYCGILERQAPGALGASFYAQVWNNLGSTFARQFQFEDAADAFLNAWKLSHTKDTLRHYVSVLPLYLSREEYKERLKDLGADQVLAERIQEYNARIAQNAEAANEKRKKNALSPEETVKNLMEEYRRGSCMLHGIHL